ncbi:uncharacterized protein [Ambystoma mexicanum]|uniref:uncharacterized protein n=1 Tax=Ambystoma mexicanum TaxID=8296 RepID=UPI0037E78D18
MFEKVSPARGGCGCLPTYTMISIGVWILLHQFKIMNANDQVVTLMPDKVITEVGGAAVLNCSFTKSPTNIFWYKEKEDGSLIFLHQSINNPPTAAAREYSSILFHVYSWVINNTVQSVSGVYYCATNPFGEPRLSNRAKVFITNTTQSPRLSILLPQEDPQLPGEMVLLCVVSGVTNDWGPVLWHIDSHEFQGQTDAGVFDAEGVFSVRSLLVVPGEIWRQRKSCSCSIINNLTGQTFTTTFSRKTDGNCRYAMYFGLPCTLILLLIQIMLLILCRERLFGVKQQPRVRLEMTETPYATVK